MQPIRIASKYDSTTYERVPSKKNSDLHIYLQRIDWDIKKFNNAQLEIMLVAACLRFLGGLTDVDFVLKLSKEIHQKYRTTMKLSLWYSTERLQNLADEIAEHTILEKNEMYEFVNDAQEVITKKRFTF